MKIKHSLIVVMAYLFCRTVSESIKVCRAKKEIMGDRDSNFACQKRCPRVGYGKKLILSE